jgi:N-acylneuraminate cytidylyltransferase
MYTLTENKLVPLFKKVNNIEEPYNQCRQILPKCYLHNGYIDIFNTSILEDSTISGERIYPYVMNREDTLDIDEAKDWK